MKAELASSGLDEEEILKKTKAVMKVQKLNLSIAVYG